MWTDVKEAEISASWVDLTENGWGALIGWAAGLDNLRRRGGGGAGLTGPGAVWGSPPGREPCSPGQPCGERPLDSAPEPCSPFVAVGAGPGSGPPWDVRKVFERGYSAWKLSVFVPLVQVKVSCV
jgi:hypothetical protein